tara:strand:- start:3474 stop:4511 length:1038 start_codon:yes stop_codon:yes gene_type:complete
MNKSKEYILISGAAGFIGAALVKKLLNDGFNVIGFDNLNNYYSQKLKYDRLKTIDLVNKKSSATWEFHKLELEEKKLLENVFEKYRPRIVVNLAAQAGVRYSIKNPESYISSNIVGFSNLLECCRKFNVENLIYASSSSVYGANTKLPFFENQEVNHPISLYAASKRSNELMAHAYSNIFDIPCTGLRFFTVYGPWGRPDMAPMIFAKSIFDKKPIDVFNHGNMQRDFTYIDDVIEGIFRCCFKPATPNISFDSKNPEASSSFAPHRIFNVGNSNPVSLLKFIEIIEEEIGIKAIKRFKSIQPGDVMATSADISKLHKWIGFRPEISIKDGISFFIRWFKNYYLD